MTGSSRAPFQPITVGRMKLGHRIAMAPLTRMRADNETRVLPDMSLLYYEQRASRPGTLIITESSFPSEKAGGYARVPGVYTKDQMDQWKRIYDTIHAKNCYVFHQLLTLGRVAQSAQLGNNSVVSASDVSTTEGESCRPMSSSEIRQYIADYVQAARNAVDNGADGVEIHAGNGYLLDQFLHENTNKRTDEYGGSIENRARFVLEAVDAVADAIGPDRTAVRFAPWGQYGEVNYGISPIPQWGYLAAELERRKREGKELAYVHLIEPRVHENTDRECGPQESNDFFRLIYSGTLIRAGALADINVIEKLVSKDDRLLVALGRYFVSNPDLVDRIEHGYELTKYNRPTFYTDGAEGYIDYPFYTPSK